MTYRDAFDRAKDRRDREMRRQVSVPAPLSAKCETRACGGCTGEAISRLTDKQAPCSCRCHKGTKR